MSSKTLRKRVTHRNRSYKHLVKKSILDGENVACNLCGEVLTVEDISIDHIIPKSKGGSLTWDNLQPTHKRCNNLKGDNLQDIKEEG